MEPPRVLLSTALLRLVAGMVVIACLFFVPAGTLSYWEAWIYMGILFGSTLLIGGYLFLKDPELLERRMRTRETARPQQTIIAVFILLLLVLFLVPGIDHRYGWSQTPSALILLADAIILLGFLLFVLTIRENRFASRVIEVQEGQAVVSTGPYALVRHPMYLAMGLVLGFSPLALGSLWGLIPSVFVPLLLAQRIAHEEQVLKVSLPGYEEYTQRVRFRMIPFIW